MAKGRCSATSEQDTQPSVETKTTRATRALPHLMRALNLHRAFAFHHDHPLYKQKVLEVKGLLETTERILLGKQYDAPHTVIGTPSEASNTDSYPNTTIATGESDG